jgi:Cu2+-exporting ATPase
MRLVAAAQASTSHTQALADRAAAILFYVAVAAGTSVTFSYVLNTRARAYVADIPSCRPA